MARKLAVAIVLLGCFALATAQVEVAAKSLPFGTPNGLWAAFSGTAAPGAPPSGFWSLVEQKKHDVVGAGVLLALPGAPGPVPLQATADYQGLTFDQFPTWTATVSAFPGGEGATTVTVVMADANTMFGYPIGTAILNPPTAAGAVARWSRVGPALPTKDPK